MSIELPAEAGSRIRRLTDVSRALTYAASLDDVFDLSVDCAIELLGASKAVLALHDADGMARIRAARGVGSDTVAEFGERLDETLVTSLENVFGPGAHRRFLGVPLVVRGRITGLLAVDLGREQGSGEQEEWLLSALADQTSIALEAAGGDEARSALEARVRVLERDQEQTQQAVRIASHDLRTPLGAMQGYLAMLSGGVYGPLTDRQKEILERVQAVGRHLGSVLETVLEFAHLTAEQRILTREVAVERVVRDALAVLAPAAEGKGIHLRSEIEPAAATVMADPDLLRQVLIHLLDNAVKYSPVDTTVLVAGVADGDGRWAAIRVLDEGPGVPVEYADEIFLPSRRLAVQGREDPGGTGFGLAIAKRLVEQMAGSLALEEGRQRGACFRVRLRRPTAALGGDAET